MLNSVFVNGFFQLFHIILGGNSDCLLFELTLAGIRFKNVESVNNCFPSIKPC
jgi:hypothetical protein